MAYAIMLIFIHPIAYNVVLPYAQDPVIGWIASIVIDVALSTLFFYSIIHSLVLIGTLVAIACDIDMN